MAHSDPLAVQRPGRFVRQHIDGCPEGNSDPRSGQAADAIRPLLITSNLVFSQWDRIFKSPMTTAAAIDRLVHHSVVLEIDRTSIRAEEAQARNGKRPAQLPPPPAVDDNNPRGDDNYENKSL